MRMRLGSDELKQIFTPYNVCHFMALATMGNVAEQVEKSGFITVHDDCCGGGATLIAAANVAPVSYTHLTGKSTVLNIIQQLFDRY